LKNKFIDYNDAVTDPDRVKLRLPLRDKKPTPKPVSTSRPALEVVPTNNRQHTIRGRKKHRSMAIETFVNLEVTDNGLLQ
jgi:hypothetical protein